MSFLKPKTNILPGGMTMIRDLILKSRSTRRFYENQPVTLETLRQLVDLARLSPSARNAQPLKYILSCEPEKNAKIFPTLAWAAYLKDWGGPKIGERPAAYIIVLGDKSISQTFGIDPGIAAQSIMLGANEIGLGGCIMTSVQKEALTATLTIPAQYEIILAIALGKPRETIVVEKVSPDGDIKYWRDAQGVHHVPKRDLDDLIVG
jgi:nitroreductase